MIRTDLNNHSADGDDAAFAQLVDEVVEHLQAGEETALEGCLSRHPQYAARLGKLLPTLYAMVEAGRPPSDAVGDAEPKITLPEEAFTDRVLADFRILREIGRGGMGVVYEAEQISLRRRVALKTLTFGATLDQRQLQRFRNESRAAALLDHPNIVSVYSVGSASDVHYYAMQYIEGRTLAEEIARMRREADGGATDGSATTLRDSDRPGMSESPACCGGSREARSPEEGRQAEKALAQEGASQEASGDDRTAPYLPEEVLVETHAGHDSDDTRARPDFDSSDQGSGGRLARFRWVARIGIQVAEALEHAHGLGVVHRDIKPSNLMVDDEEHLWVTDFGLAQAEANPGLTMTGDIVGTLRYMSPEQATGDRHVLDHRTDIYSLGVTLYELLALRPAADARRQRDVFRQIVERDPPRLRQVDRSIPRDLEVIVGKAMAKDPQSRYGSAQELADDLRRFLDDEPIQAKPPGLVERAGKWARRNRGIVAASLATLAVAVLFAAGLLWQERSQTFAALAREEEQRGIAQQQREAAEQKAEEARAVAEFLVRDLLASAAPEETLGRSLTVEQVLANAEQRIDEAFEDQPRLEAAVRHTMGVVYLDLGRYAAAKRHIVRALELRRRVLGPESPDTLSTMNALANLYQAQGDLEEAGRLNERLLEVRRRVLGPEDSATLGSMQNLANVLRSQGELEKARDLCEQALAIRRRKFGLEHPNTLDLMNNLAIVRSDQGDLEGAEKLYEQALEMQRRVLGPDDPRTLNTMNNLAVLLKNEGGLQAARKLHEQTLKLRRRVLGPEHPDTLTSMSNLASVLHELGEHDASRELRRQTLELERRVLGPGHPRTVGLLNRLTSILEAAGKHVEAVDLWGAGWADVAGEPSGESPPKDRTIDYRVRISQAGTYQAYVRWDSCDAYSGAICVGLLGADGVASKWYLLEGGYREIGGGDADFATFTWETFGHEGQTSSEDLDQPQEPAVWDVPRPGEYTLRIWPIDEGAAVDALVLQQADLDVPQEDDPGESRRTEAGVFVASDGRITIEAEHFTSREPSGADDARWRIGPGETRGFGKFKNYRAEGYVQALPRPVWVWPEKVLGALRSSARAADLLAEEDPPASPLDLEEAVPAIRRFSGGFDRSGKEVRIRPHSKVAFRLGGSTSYLLRARWTRQSGHQDVGFLLPLGEQKVALTLSGWKGTRDALWTIDEGQVARPSKFENHQPHLLEVLVDSEGTETGIYIFLDGKRWLPWQGDRPTCEVARSNDVPVDGVLGIYNHGNELVMHSMTATPIRVPLVPPPEDLNRPVRPRHGVTSRLASMLVGPAAEVCSIVAPSLEEQHRPGYAERAYRAAIGLRDVLQRIRIDADPDVLRAQADDYHHLGKSLASQQRFEEAEQAFTEAVQLWERSEVPQDSPEHLRDLADSLVRLGGVQRQLKRTGAALSSFQQAAEVLDRPACDGAGLDSLTSLAYLCWRLAEEFDRLDRLGEQEAAYRRALRLFNRAVALAPDSLHLRQERAMTCRRLAGLLRRRGNPDSAEAFARTALQGYRLLAQEKPEHSFYRQEIAYTERLVSGALRDLGHVQEANQHRDAAFATYRELAMERPENARYRQEMAGIRWQTAKRLESLGKHKETEAEYREALAIDRRAVAELPHKPGLRRHLVIVTLSLAEFLLDRDRDREAASLLETLPAHFEQWERLQPDHEELPRFQSMFADLRDRAEQADLPAPGPTPGEEPAGEKQPNT